MDATSQAEQRAAIVRDSVALNRQILNACPRPHQFDASAIDWERGHLPARFNCLRCGGWMADLQAVAYAEGIADAGGDPEAVIEGFGR